MGGDDDASRGASGSSCSHRAGLVSQGANARDGVGRPVGISSDSAESWSLLAGIALAATDGISIANLPVALRALVAEIGVGSLKQWHDSQGRMQHDVLDALDSAIERIDGVSR